MACAKQIFSRHNSRPSGSAKVRIAPTMMRKVPTPIPIPTACPIVRMS